MYTFYTVDISTSSTSISMRVICSYIINTIQYIIVQISRCLPVLPLQHPLCLRYLTMSY